MCVSEESSSYSTARKQIGTALSVHVLLVLMEFTRDRLRPLDVEGALVLPVMTSLCQLRRICLCDPCRRSPRDIHCSTPPHFYIPGCFYIPLMAKWLGPSQLLTLAAVVSSCAGRAATVGGLALKVKSASRRPPRAPAGCPSTAQRPSGLYCLSPSPYAAPRGTEGFQGTLHGVRSAVVEARPAWARQSGGGAPSKGRKLRQQAPEKGNADQAGEKKEERLFERVIRPVQDALSRHEIPAREQDESGIRALLEHRTYVGQTGNCGVNTKAGSVAGSNNLERDLGTYVRGPRNIACPASARRFFLRALQGDTDTSSDGRTRVRATVETTSAMSALGEVQHVRVPTGATRGSLT